jgi:hypothetical protein
MTPHFKSIQIFYTPTTTSIQAIIMSKTSEQDIQKAIDRINVLKSHLSHVEAPAGRLSKLSRSLRGKKAIVTGAASGMGKETAKVLADEGVQVAVLDLDEGRVKAVVDEINAVHAGRAKGWVCDVADRSRIKQVCKEVIEDFGGLDVRSDFSNPSMIQLNICTTYRSLSTMLVSPSAEARSTKMHRSRLAGIRPSISTLRLSQSLFEHACLLC